MAVEHEHRCVSCRALPVQGATDADGNRLPGPYRPTRARPVVEGKGGPKSQRCATHWREFEAATRAQDRTRRKARKFRVSRELQAELWALQGCACPCGAKFDPTGIPAGVHLEHDHEEAEGHDHPNDEGCEDCVLGFTCAACNVDVIGRLTGRTGGRAGAMAALFALAEFMNDPPMARLRRRRPALTEVPA